MNEIQKEAIAQANAYLNNAGLPLAPEHPFLSLTSDNRIVILRDAANAWSRRCQSLALRKGTKMRANQLEAFLQGALAVLTSTRILSQDDAHRVGFLVMVDRAEELIERWASDRTDAEAAEDCRSRAAGLAEEGRKRSA